MPMIRAFGKRPAADVVFPGAGQVHQWIGGRGDVRERTLIFDGGLIAELKSAASLHLRIAVHQLRLQPPRIICCRFELSLNGTLMMVVKRPCYPHLQRGFRLVLRPTPP